MAEALEWASANEEAVRAAIATNLEIPEEAAAGITLPTFTWELDGPTSRNSLRSPSSSASSTPSPTTTG